MRDARMAQEPSKESQIIEELLRKLDAERQKVSRLESELSEYKAPDQMRKAYEANQAEGLHHQRSKGYHQSAESHHQQAQLGYRVAQTQGLGTVFREEV